MMEADFNQVLLEYIDQKKEIMPLWTKKPSGIRI